MQSDYKDSDPEMLTMHMIFDGVEKFEWVLKTMCLTVMKFLTLLN